MALAYPAIIALAIVVGLLIGRVTQDRLALSSAQKIGIAIGGFIGAMIAAKIPFVLADTTGLISGAAWLSNGKTILLGLVGGYFGVVIAKWALEIRIPTGDSLVVPVATAIAIGRIGCFIAGCCYGTPTSLPWGVVFPNVDNQPRHPTQIYEFLFHATMAVVLYFFWRKQILPRQLSKLYILCYIVFRFLTEFIRPEARLWYGLTGYQWACFVLAGLFIWLWWRDSDAAVLAIVAPPSRQCAEQHLSASQSQP